MTQTRLLSLLALMAIALRAMVPTGYMVGVDETTGLMRVEICHGGLNGVVEKLWLDAKSGELIDEDPAAPPQKDDGPCAFASLTAMDMPSAGLMVEPAMFTWLIGAKPVARDAIDLAPRRLLPPLRGPPLHV